MTDILDFLRARLDDDEWLAARDPEGRPLNRVDLTWEYRPDGDPCDGGSVVARGHRILVDSPLVIAAHVARWDPARVLAGVEAGRQVIRIHEGPHTCGVRDYDDTDPCPTLRALALPHSSHPEYDDTWRPA